MTKTPPPPPHAVFHPACCPPVLCRYEPWVLVDRKAACWHDTRFRGYGWDKIIFISALNASFFDFIVHPTAFLVHRNHPHTPARSVGEGARAGSGLVGTGLPDGWGGCEL